MPAHHFNSTGLRSALKDSNYKKFDLSQFPSVLPVIDRVTERQIPWAHTFRGLVNERLILSVNVIQQEAKALKVKARG